MAVCLDTTILVDFLRGHPQAVHCLNTLQQRPLVSAYVLAELFAGVRDVEERPTLERMIQDGLHVIPVTAQRAAEAGLLYRQYRPSHGLDLGDAIIAATSLAASAPLYTLNRRHFPMLPDLVVPY